MSWVPACKGCPLTSCPFTPKRRPAGELLHLEGAEAAHVWYLRRGRVVRIKAQDGQGDRATRLEEGGAFLGLEALVDDRYRASARVVDDAVICRSSREAFEAWIGPPGTPARIVLEGLLGAGQTGRSPDRLDGTALARLARWLLAEGPPPAGMKRRFLAELLGMTPETLSRGLARLAQRGAIVLGRRHLAIIDREALSAAS